MRCAAGPSLLGSGTGAALMRHADGPLTMRYVAERTVQLVLRVSIDGRVITGDVTGAGFARPFSGRLGLITAIEDALDRAGANGPPSTIPVTPGPAATTPSPVPGTPADLGVAGRGRPQCAPATGG
jgi:hypothetical protein